MAVSLRSRRRFGARSRKDALPYASVGFLVMLALLAVWHYNGHETNNRSELPNAMLNFASVRTADYGDLCTNDNIFSNRLSLLFLIPTVIFMFVGLAIVTDEYFVAALERICERLNLTEDVAGATFMAAGSSTPEFFASMLGVFVTEDEVGVGTIVGSAVFNILVIIGLSAALAGSVLSLDWRPLARDSFFYIWSIILLIIFILGPSRGEIEWWEGLILVFGYVTYVLFMAYGNSPYMAWAGKLKFGRSPIIKDMEKGISQDSDFTSPSDIASRADSSTMEIFPYEKPSPEPKYNAINPRSKFRAVQYAVIAANRLVASSVASGERSVVSDTNGEDNSRSFLGVDLPTSKFGWILLPVTFPWQLAFRYTILDCSVDTRAHLWWLTFLLSIVWISGISYVMVEAARISGCLLNIPATALGLTVIAAGTSVPDALASISVAKGGAGDMAISNAIGSNVFDILLGLGFPWFLGALTKGRRIVVPVDPIGSVVIPIVILFAIIITLVLLLILLRWKLRPLLGYILFGIYGLFVTYTLLDVYKFKIGQEGV